MRASLLHRFLSISLCVPILYFSNQLSADPTDLFSATVAVSSDSKAARRRVASAALQQVLVKASGDNRVIERYTTLRSAINNASNSMVSYQYLEKPHPRAIRGQSPILTDAIAARPQQLLKMGFDEKAVRTILRQAGAPFWQLPRQAVIVWLAWQQDGVRDIVNSESFPDVVAFINNQAARRGLPVVHPLLDLEERQLIKVDDVWSSDLNTLQRASAPYDKGAILFGKVAQTYDQRYLGQWSSVVDGRLLTQSFESDNPVDFIANGIDFVADQLAEMYAARGNMNLDSDAQVLIVEGVSSVDAYHSLVSALENIDAIDHLILKQVEQSRFLFQFKSAASIDKVVNLLKLNDHLQPIGHSANRFEAEFNVLQELRYRWKN